MQCKDIPDRPILEFLLRHDGKWCNWFFGDERDVHLAMPPGTPDKLVLAKMRMLIRRGLVDGCPCGCRGDFEITDKGRDLVSRTSEMITEHESRGLRCKMMLSHGWRPIVSDAQAAHLLRRELKRQAKNADRKQPIASPWFLLSIKKGNWFKFINGCIQSTVTWETNGRATR